MNSKRCFVIAPIGESGSSTRVRSNQVLNHIIKPVLSRFGFDVTRADDIAEPGIISTQVLERVINDSLVIADLAERNPNVYYELAVRHAARKPVIQLAQKGEPLPFDIAGTRTIVVDHRDLDSVEDAKRQLARYIENVENASPTRHDSPISLALDLQALRASSDPQQASLADIVERVTRVHGAILSIQTSMDKSLTYRLDELLRIALGLKGHFGEEGSSSAVSGLSESVDGLRTRLIEAVSNILDKIQERNSELATRIQAVFQEQSNTATDIVEQSFANAIADAIPDDPNRDRLLKQLVEYFMHGMSSMGTYQHINVIAQTEASTEAIRQQINKSIEDVFLGIDTIEKQVLSLALPAG